MKDKTKDKISSGWTTHDEMNFIDGIGTGAFVRVTIGAPRALLLERYERAIELRARWGHVSKAEVLVYLAGARAQILMHTHSRG